MNSSIITHYYNQCKSFGITFTAQTLKEFKK